MDKIIAGGDTADTDTCILQFLEVTDCKDPSVHILFLQKHKKYHNHDQQEYSHLNNLEQGEEANLQVC